MKKTFLLFAFGIALTAAIATSCGSKPKLLTEVEMKARIDSLYSAQAAQLGPELDQLCEAKFESLVQTAVDSIVAANNPEVQ